MSKTKPVILVLTMLIFSLQLQVSLTSGRSLMDKSLAPLPLSTAFNSLHMSAKGVPVQWNYETSVTSAAQEEINPSQKTVIPAENTNSSVSFKILQIGGPIGLLTLALILIYWLFFHKTNNWSCYIRRENPTVDENNYNCGIELKCRP
uniref:Uncharacterized protein n=1 Tax=Opuntia streptacantha TaxID=393608 RepID=A0A7C9FEW7_OPUST